MKDAERRRHYAAEVGEDALRRQMDEAKFRRNCCGTWKHEPHAPECRAGKAAARRARS